MIGCVLAPPTSQQVTRLPWRLRTIQPFHSKHLHLYDLIRMDPRFHSSEGAVGNGELPMFDNTECSKISVPGRSDAGEDVHAYDNQMASDCLSSLFPVLYRSGI